ncbi:MAG: rhodanese-like domain-containing protein [Verrucomicrobiota bacterium]|nr:rhodanese-like domain-containing protein [Verrucomicrobiota bacterium]
MGNRYQRLVTGARAHVTEISPADAAAQRQALIIDVREKEEWDAGHIPDAQHLSRGTLEVEIEALAPDLAMPIILHCGAGGRSALAAESLQKMGYTNVKSMAGGLTAWKAAGLPTER